MKKYISDPAINFFISVIGLVVIFSVLMELKQIFIPLVIAYFLFFVFEPLNKILRNKKLPDWLIIPVDFIIILSFIWGISEVMIRQFSQFGTQLPLYEQKLNSIISSTAISLGLTDPILTNMNIGENIEEILTTLNLDYAGIAGGVFSSTVSLFSTSIFVLFFFIFILSGNEKIFAAIKNRYVHKHINFHAKKHRKKLRKETMDEDINKSELLSKVRVEKGAVIENTFKNITDRVQNYIFTKFLISIVTGILVGIVLALFGVDFVLVWVVLTILLNFIPTIGSIIAVILPMLMTIVQFESFTTTILVTGIIGAIQNLVGNILEPKIMGNKLGLNPLVILISLMLWGYVWGIPGMFISVPLTAIIKIIISNSESENLQFISNLMGN
ncbi:MAG: AI-2E family transporter [Rhodothermaceae bacterium]